MALNWISEKLRSATGAVTAGNGHHAFQRYNAHHHHISAGDSDAVMLQDRSSKVGRVASGPWHRSRPQPRTRHAHAR